MEATMTPPTTTETDAKVVEEIECSGSVAFALYPGLTIGCFEALHATADERIKAVYLPKLGTGEWAGTMCITEPQAGTDLGSIKTRAVPQADGSHLVEGAKIFISSGEHDLAGNIIHFVLARLLAAPWAPLFCSWPLVTGRRLPGFCWAPCR